MDFFERRELYRHVLLSYLSKEIDLYLLTEMHGNIGDHLIWAGTNELLNSGNIKFKCVSMKNISNAKHMRSTLLIPGSGAFNKYWHEWLPELVLKSSKNFEKVIILPSSYDTSVSVVVECLNQPNVYPFAREAESYSSTKHLNRASLCLDCAIFFKFDDMNIIDNVKKNQSPLIALREDVGSLLKIQGYAPSHLNEDISLTTACLKDWLQKIYSSSTVVTDRLHVAVAAILFRKKLIYFETYDKKISTYFNYTFKETFSDNITECALSWLIENKYVLPINDYS